MHNRCCTAIFVFFKKQLRERPSQARLGCSPDPERPSLHDGLVRNLHTAEGQRAVRMLSGYMRARPPGVESVELGPL